MPARSGRRFATTRWSVVLAADSSASPAARAALSALCETYWSPVYDFVRHRGQSADDARDLTQAFFARVIEKGEFKHARPERGRFRTFLLTAVQHFMANQSDHDRAAKRGGTQAHVSIGSAVNDEHASVDPAGAETPEAIYERRWALSALDDAMTRLEAECGREDRAAVFGALRPFLTGDDRASFAAAAAALGLQEGSLRVALHRMRRQFGQCLRETLSETVDDPAEVDHELEFLLRVITRRPTYSSLGTTRA